MEEPLNNYNQLTRIYQHFFDYRMILIGILDKASFTQTCASTKFTKKKKKTILEKRKIRLNG